VGAAVDREHGAECLRFLLDCLRDAGWHSIHCDTCGKDLWIAENANRCQSCEPLTEQPRKPEPARWEPLWRALYTSFAESGFSPISTAQIMRSRRRSTLFIGAGLQIFEGAIYDGEPVSHGPLFVHQPVVRLNYLNSVHKPGYATGFVNLCTEQTQSNHSHHAAHLMAWLNALSFICVRPLEIVFERDRWVGGPFKGSQLQVRVGGHSIVGDAVFIDDGPAEASRMLPISDFSFGLERIVAAAGRSADFWPSIAPCGRAPGSGDRQALDALRTAVLLALGNVRASSRRHGRELRRLCRIAARLPQRFELGVTAMTFGSYWCEFLPKDGVGRDLGLAVEDVLSEVRRARGHNR
jgi:hypothetical protein